MSRTRQGGDEPDLSGQDTSRSGPSSRRRWTTAEIAGILSLGLGVLVFFVGDGLLRDSDEPPPVSSTTSSAPSATASGTPPGDSTATSSQSPPSELTTASLVRWTGMVRLGAGVDLDKVPPTIRTSEKDADITESSSFFVPSIKAQEQSLAPWSDSAAPTRQQCVEALSTQGSTEWGETGREDLETGDIFCVRTSEGRIASIKLKDASYHHMQATVKIWDAVESL